MHPIAFRLSKSGLGRVLPIGNRGEIQFAYRQTPRNWTGGSARPEKCLVRTDASIQYLLYCAWAEWPKLFVRRSRNGEYGKKVGAV